MVGLDQTRSSLQVKGAIQGNANTTGVTAVLTDIRFHVTQAAGGNDVDLTPGTTIIKYVDERQTKIFASTAGFTVSGIGTADSDLLLERNEVYEIKLINLNTTGEGDDSLTYTLGVNKTFTLEIIPTRGTVLQIERTTPIFMDAVNFLN